MSEVTAGWAWAQLMKAHPPGDPLNYCLEVLTWVPEIKAVADEGAAILERLEAAEPQGK